MKARVILWDRDGKGEAWVNKNIHAERIDIVQVIPQYENNIRFISNDVDLIFVATDVIYQVQVEALTGCGFSSDKIVFLYSLGSWYNHFDTAIYLLKDCSDGFTMRKMIFWLYECKHKGYCTCKIDDMIFFASANDTVIMPTMYCSGTVWSADEMAAFYQLAHEYYNIHDDQQGYFLDLGANIGTTCIYFRKILDNSVKIIAFEPDTVNNRYLQMNMQLNGLADEACIEAYGLSDRSEVRVMYHDEYNPGATSLLMDRGGEKSKVSLITLDDYFADNKLDATRIKYIWIDVEGFEPFVVAGASNILKRNAIPLYMEFSPYLWSKYGTFEDILSCLYELGYTKYILIQDYLQGRKEIMPVSTLRTFPTDISDFQQDIFLIKEQ